MNDANVELLGDTGAPATDGLATPPSLPQLYNAARRALAECRNIDDAKLLRNKAMALVVFATQAKDRTLIEDATEIRLRAERRAGELLRETEKNKGGGDRKSDHRSHGTTGDRETLKQIGVTKTQSSNWQRLAALEVEAFEARVERGKRKAVNVLDGTSRRTRQEMHDDDAARVAQLRLVAGTFMTLVIDFPWKSDVPYATMSVDELMALPVPRWAAEQCHLYFWTPGNFMPLAVAAVAHYGFVLKAVITWRKPHWGRGFYFRNQTEFCLFAVKGELRTRSDEISNIFDAPVGEHSEKPERLYQIIREASYLPAGEAFQRQPRDGFVNLYAAREDAR